MDVTEQLADVSARVVAAAREAGRSPADVKLIAVSKTFPLSAVQQAHAAGHVHFGESRGQELRDKARELADVHWHFIGRIQTNKAKYIAPVAYRIHALESAHQAAALSARAPHQLKCLLAVNVGREAQKSGVLPEQTLSLAEQLALTGDVDVVGLMCIPPRGVNSDPFYAELADLAARGRAKGLALDELSMGMSSDYEAAVRHGATWVRVGSAIFGVRT